MTATKLNADVNPIYNEFNGNIDNANISASAAIVGTKLAAATLTDTQVSATADIQPTKVGDASAADSDHNTTADPGDSSSNNLPTTLEGEIQQLRYAMLQSTLGVSAKITDGSSSGLAADGVAAWFDGNVVGPSVMPNGSFLDDVSVKTATNPEKWTVIDGGSGGPSTLTTVSLDRSEGIGLAIHMVDSGAAGRDGIRNTLTGLKASSKYMVVARIKPITTTWKLTTTGATGTFGNLDIESSSGTGAWETLAGVIQTDATPTDIVVNLIAGASASECHIGMCHVYPIADDRVERQAAPWIVRAATSTSSTVSTIEDDTTVSVVVPGDGYHISVTGQMVGSGSAQDVVANCDIEQDIDGGGWSAVARSQVGDNAGANLDVNRAITTLYDLDNPTPGSSYSFRLTGAISVNTGTGSFAFNTDGANNEIHRIRVVLSRG